MSNKSLKNESNIQKNKQELNTLKVLLQSLKYQLEELDSVNKNIDNLDSELKGGNKQEKKREKKFILAGANFSSPE